MLIARPSKRTAAEQFANDLRFDILAGDQPRGRLTGDRKSLGATFGLDDRRYTVEHTRGAEEERVYQAATRLVTGRPPPPPDRYDLKDEDGRVLASAEQAGEVFQVTRDQDRFRFAKGRSRLLFDLTRDGATSPLGSVGQRRFWTLSMHMDLPDALGAPFQVFLLSLLLALIQQRAERMTSAT